MKSTGIVRKVDELGRVVIPIELRRTLGIEQNDSLEIYVDDNKIIFEKYIPNQICSITGEDSESNFSLLDGDLTLSVKGAKQLIADIQKHLDERK